MTTTSVLLVEDDANIVDLIRSNLLVRGFAVNVSNGSDALNLVASFEPELVILDLMLPGEDGFELCRAIRERSSCGIVVVSARGGEFDKVRALNLGADDYLTKPFGIEELIARITATLRRSRPAPATSIDAEVVTVGDVTIDIAAQSVAVAGARVHMTPTEFAVLRELARSQGSIVTHSELLRNVWGPGYATQTEYLRVYVRRLRNKLGDPNGDVIITEPRAGYRLDDRV
jgi:two-component system KDP operon response regulator KdpE